MGLVWVFPLSDWAKNLTMRTFYHACQNAAWKIALFKLLTHHYITPHTLLNRSNFHTVRPRTIVERRGILCHAVFFFVKSIYGNFLRLVKPEKWIFCEKIWLIFFSSNQFTIKFNSVIKGCKTRSQYLRKRQYFFREINVFTKEITKYSGIHFSTLWSHSMEITKILSHAILAKISWK